MPQACGEGPCREVRDLKEGVKRIRQNTQKYPQDRSLFGKLGGTSNNPHSN